MNAEQEILVKRLKEAELDTQRFLKVGKPGCSIEDEKAAFEPAFPEHLYGPEDLDNYPRWGILGCNFLVLIDTDDPRIYEALNKVLPETFEVTSPRRGLPHKYLVVCGQQVPNKKLHLPDVKDEKGRLKDLGEIRANNHYLVAPGSQIRYIDKQTGEVKTGMYLVTKNIPLARMEYPDFLKAVRPYIAEADGNIAQTITAEEMEEGVTEGSRHPKCLSYAGKLVWLGLAYPTALLHLRTWNENLCKPPLPDKELTRILRDCYGYNAEEEGVTFEEALRGRMTENATKTKGENTWQSDDLIDFFLEDIEKKVKQDVSVKISVFATGLSTFLDSPINLFLRGESGVGKSYNVTEVMKYFPQDDVWYLGGMSQKSLVHGYGVLLNKEGSPIDLDSKPTEPKRRDFDKDDKAGYNKAIEQYKSKLKLFNQELKGSYTLVDLSRKILVFLEAPEYNTFQMLRPILSHDKLEIEYQFVEKIGKGQLRTVRVIIRGWPATIFLTLDRRYMEELSTRSFSVTPGNSEDKIEQANLLTNEKVSLPWKYEAETVAFTTISELIERIRDLTAKGKVKVIIPFSNLYELFPKQVSRDMRDFTHFCELLQSITLLHYYQRPIATMGKDKYVLSTLADVTRALDVYKEIFETTRTGTEKRTLEFYHDIMIKKDEPDNFKVWYLKELTEAYNATAKKKLSERSVRVMLDRLDEIGYINIREDDDDKRRNIFIPLMKVEEKLQNTVENVSSIESLAKMKTGFETWLKTIAETLGFYYNKNISETTEDWAEEPISREQLQRAVLTGKIFCLIPIGGLLQ